MNTGAGERVEVVKGDDDDTQSGDCVSVETATNGHIATQRVHRQHALHVHTTVPHWLSINLSIIYTCLSTLKLTNPIIGTAY